MASAFYDEANANWILVFHGIHERKRWRQVRVRAERLPTRDRDEQQVQASAMAIECDRYCRTLEVAPDREEIRHALRIKAITADQAEALLGGMAAPTPRPLADRMTLEAAANLHPSTQREPLEAQLAHHRYLTAFCEQAEITDVADLRLDQVQRYVAWMVAEKIPWDTRRHRLMYVRRAARMGATAGIPDVLGGIVLDRQGRRPPVQAWTLDELGDALVHFERSSNRRALVATALGGFLGLGPSEIFRIDVGDLRLDGMLPYAIGPETKAKNECRRRVLPVPPTIIGWIRELAAGRDADEPLVHAQRGTPPKKPHTARAKANRRRFQGTSFAHWLGPLLETATGRDLPPKALRKSFASWATRAKLPALHVEQFLGHENDLVGTITGRHYLDDVHEIVAEMLKPTAELIEAALVKALAKSRAKALIQNSYTKVASAVTQ